MFELTVLNVLKTTRFKKWDWFRFWKKYWELNLELKGSEYISVFPLIFQFSLNVSYSCKSADKLAIAACKEPIYSYFLFLHFMYHLSLIYINYNLSEYLYFCKMKTFKTCRKVKITISPRGGNFQFSARGENHVYLKKNPTPWGEFHLVDRCLSIT